MLVLALRERITSTRSATTTAAQSAQLVSSALTRTVLPLLALQARTAHLARRIAQLARLTTSALMEPTRPSAAMVSGHLQTLLFALHAQLETHAIRRAVALILAK